MLQASQAILAFQVIVELELLVSLVIVEREHQASQVILAFLAIAEQ